MIHCVGTREPRGSTTGTPASEYAASGVTPIEPTIDHGAPICVTPIDPPMPSAPTEPPKLIIGKLPLTRNVEPTTYTGNSGEPYTAAVAKPEPPPTILTVPSTGTY